MSILQFANNAQSTLAGPLGTADTSASLAAGTGALFPTLAAGQSFKLTLYQAAPPGTTNEIVLVTARSGDVLTIVRGQEGTSAKTWLVGDIAAQLVTAGDLAAFVQADQIQTGAFNRVTAGGSVNAITGVLPSSLTTLSDGMQILFTAAGANTAAATFTLTLQTTTTATLPIVKGPDSALVAGNIPEVGYPVMLVYSAALNQWVMTNPSPVINNAFGTIASASTTDLGSVSPMSNNINVTGSATINSFGSDSNVARPVYTLKFAGASTLVDSAAILLPGGKNIVTAAGDSCIAQYLGSGNWAVLAYFRAAALPPTFVPGANGYEINSQGKIEQWGVYPSDVSGDQTLVSINFPIPFPTACFNCLLTDMNPVLDKAADGTMEFVNLIGSSSPTLGSGAATGFNAELNMLSDSTGTVVHGFMWRAVGY